MPEGISSEISSRYVMVSPPKLRIPTQGGKDRREGRKEGCSGGDGERIRRGKYIVVRERGGSCRGSEDEARRTGIE